jgi:LL-diaminopimelate aminotransferase
MRFSQRLQKMPVYVFAGFARTIAEKRAAGIQVINLGIGDPDLPAPNHVLDALCNAAREPANQKYPDYFGQPFFREAVASWYERRFGVTLDPSTEVVALIGSKEGTSHVSLSLLDPGELAIVPSPGYPTYTYGAVLAGAEYYEVPIVQDEGFLLDVERIPKDVAAKAKLLWLNYPNNPTGATADLDYFEKVVWFAKRHDLALLHDNPYSEITYDGYVAPSILQVSGARDVAMEFHSLSKTYNMTGFRIGMAVGNRQLVSALARVKSQIDTGIFVPIQVAAASALNGDQTWLVDRNLIYQRRRDAAAQLLAAKGWLTIKPKGSIYLWGKCPSGFTSEEFTKTVLEEAAVFLTPGSSYGKGGEGYFRLSITVPDDHLLEALGRLQRLHL